MLSNKLKQLRDTTTFTQSEFAKKINVARTTYAMYEQGNREPDYKTLVRIAEYYDVTTDYLLGKTENPKTSSINNDKTFFMNKIATEFPDIDLMFKDMESLTAEQMEEVYDYIKYKVSKNKE